MPSSNGLIIGQAQDFPLSINGVNMSFSMDIVLNKRVPVIMLGKDWLKYMHARHKPKLNSLEIRHKTKKFGLILLNFSKIGKKKRRCICLNQCMMNFLEILL